MKIEQVIVNLDDYNKLINKLNFYERERELTISISGMERGWQYLGYEDGKYKIAVRCGEEIPSELVEQCKKVFKEELTVLNEKVRDFTLLKAEIEILQKQEKK